MIREPAALRVALRQWLRRLGAVRLRDVLALQDCFLCRLPSHGRLLCACCRRDLPPGPNAARQQRLATACGLDVLRVRHHYRFPLDTLIHAYKYRGELALAPVLADLLPPPPALDGGPWTLLPVPSSDRRVRERGFDHLEWIARAYAGRHGLERCPAVRRDAAGHQVGLGRQQRLRRLAAVFEIPHPPAAALLLDDVITTGSTLAALAAACRAGGTRRVGAVVLAHTPAPQALEPE